MQAGNLVASYMHILLFMLLLVHTLNIQILQESERVAMLHTIFYSP